MKEEFTAYLLGLGMTQPLINRVKELLDDFSRMTQFEIQDIYISEYMKKDGRREYEDLRIYSSGSCAFFPDFLTDNTTIFSNLRQIRAIRISRDNYDFSEARTSSKLAIDCRFFATDSAMSLKATGLNCDNLNQIFQKYIKPHISGI